MKGSRSPRAWSFQIWNLPAAVSVRCITLPMSDDMVSEVRRSSTRGNERTRAVRKIIAARAKRRTQIILNAGRAYGPELAGIILGVLSEEHLNERCLSNRPGALISGSHCPHYVQASDLVPQTRSSAPPHCEEDGSAGPFRQRPRNPRGNASPVSPKDVGPTPCRQRLEHSRDHPASGRHRDRDLLALPAIHR